jgi:NADPH-dependent curcumin reductase CurA
MQDADIARADIKRWMAEGRLKHREDIRIGFEKLPHAFIGLFKGENMGTLIVKSGESDEG